MVHIRAITQRQINLDRCAGGAIHTLKTLLNELKKSNQRLEAARLAALPLLATPAGVNAINLFQRLVQVEAMIQRSIKSAWKAREIQWNTFPGLGCSLRRTPSRSRFPEFSFRIIHPGATLTETESSEFLTQMPREIRLGISIAKLSTEAALTLEGNHDWNIQWSK